MAQHGFADRSGNLAASEERAMARTIFQPLLHKASGRTAKPTRAMRSVEAISRQALIDRRDRCMAEIARLWPQPSATGGLFEKARQLLTRHWAASSWRARADILRSAEWLIGVGKRSAASVL